MAQIKAERWSMIPEGVTDSTISDRAYRLYGLLKRYTDSEGTAFPGQETLATRRGWSTRKVQRALDELIEAGFIVVHRRPNRSNLYVIPSTIDEFGDDKSVTSGDDKSVTSGDDKSVTSGDDKSVTTYKEREPVEREPVERESRKPVDKSTNTDPRVAQLCELLADSIPQRIPNAKRPNVTQRWLTDMDRLIRLDNRDPDQIERVINWLIARKGRSADFWADQILSVRSLREKWDRMSADARRDARQRNGSAPVDAQAAQDSLFAAADRVASILDANVD